jgi:hypothetical protein
MEGLLKYARGAAILVFMLSRLVEHGGEMVPATESPMSTPVLVIAQACDEIQDSVASPSGDALRATCAEIEGGI